MANSTATAIDPTIEEKQLGIDPDSEKLLITKENVEMVCEAAFKAGLRITAESLSIQFTHPKSNRLRFMIADWKDAHRAVLNPDKAFYKALSESQAVTIKQLSDEIERLNTLLVELETQQDDSI